MHDLEAAMLAAQCELSGMSMESIIYICIYFAKDISLDETFSCS